MKEANIKENIEKYGRQYQYVFDDKGEKQDFAYSIGFEETFNHPEIMIFGLAKETMHTILSDIAYDLKGGRKFIPNKRTENVLSGEYEVLFKPVQESLHSEYAGIATRYYEKPIRIYIMFWPDKNNILPTENNCDLTVQNEALEIV